MLKANELRIGNWVGWNGPSHYENALVSVISQDEIIFRCGDSGLIQEIEPIPLTAAWLLKFGFETKENDGRFILLDGDVDILFDDDLDCWTCDGVYFSVNCLNSVHQLQNLYFALTGEELTIKKDKL